MDRTADGHRLALAAGEGAHRAVQAVEMDVQHVERPRGFFPHPLAVYARQAEEPGHRLAAEEDVGTHVEVVGEREAAEYSGVNVRMIIGAVMVMSAACAGLAGLLS